MEKDAKVEEVLKRLDNVEMAVADLKSQVSAIVAVIPHLATKADVMELRVSIRELAATLETTIIKWIVATTLATSAVAFTIAKLVN